MHVKRRDWANSVQNQTKKREKILHAHAHARRK